jgi:PKD repeat protein
VEEGTALTGLSGSFTDPGADTWTGAVNWGDGSAAEAITINQGTKTFTLPDHTYADNGGYTATVTVNDGDDDGACVFGVTVNDLGPTAHVESVPPVIAPLIVEVGEEVTFDASGSTSGPDAIVSYEWDWNYIGLVFEPSGDAGETVTHAFEEAGTYIVAVRVTDDDGSTDIATLEVVVNPR